MGEHYVITYLFSVMIAHKRDTQQRTCNNQAKIIKYIMPHRETHTTVQETMQSQMLDCPYPQDLQIIHISIHTAEAFQSEAEFVRGNIRERLSIFSQLSIIQYVGLCIFSLPISFVMIERINILCLIIIIKSKVWTITHCLGLGHETMVCALWLSTFL